MVKFVQCKECEHDFFPNQLFHGFCKNCLVGNPHGETDEMVNLTHGEIQANKRESAKAAAWNNGNGWGDK